LWDGRVPRFEELRGVELGFAIRVPESFVKSPSLNCADCRASHLPSWTAALNTSVPWRSLTGARRSGAKSSSVKRSAARDRCPHAWKPLCTRWVSRCGVRWTGTKPRRKLPVCSLISEDRINACVDSAPIANDSLTPPSTNSIWYGLVSPWKRSIEKSCVDVATITR
jgi:hypothetical protein